MAYVAATECYPSVISIKSKNGAESLHYSILYEELPDEFQSIAQKELNETDEKREKGMQRLKELMKRENLGSLDDIYILAVLRSCKYNLKKSEAKLRKFIAAYQETVTMAVNLDLDKAEKIFDDMGFGIVPYRDPNGRFILYTWPCGIRLDQYTLDDMVACFFTAALFMMTFPISTVAGLSFLGDSEVPSVKLFYDIFKRFFLHCPTFLSFPFRFKRGDIMNTIPVCYWGFKIISAIMPSKISKRVTLHKENYDSIHHMYDPKILPEQFGGNLGPKSSQLYKGRLMEFLRELKVKHNRSTSSKN